MSANRVPSNFVVAAGDCYVSFHSNFMDRYSDGSYYNDSQMEHFLRETGNRFLYSFGNHISYKTQKISKKHKQKIADKVKMMHNRPFMKSSQIYIDSGGFQVAMGALKTSDMPVFMDLYCQFLNENKDIYNYAFHLDLPPGPGTQNVFGSYQQLETLNRQSYQKMAALPDDVKSKMIYIHHFRTPSIYDTWHKFLFQEHLADGFENFATGGIVANMSTDTKIPVILYSIPLSEILHHNMKLGKKHFNFHVLGGANYVDVFYHKLFQHHIKMTHDIDVNITYDSSALFKGLAQGRFIPVRKSNGNIFKMDLRSDVLHLRCEDTSTTQDRLYEVFNNNVTPYGFKQLTPETDPVYSVVVDGDNATFSRSIWMYGMCYMMYTYSMVEAMANETVQKIYPHYLNRDQAKFDLGCLDLIVKFNNGKQSRKHMSKISSLFRSLDLLKTVDLKFNKAVVDKYLSQDDNSLMKSDILTF